MKRILDTVHGYIMIDDELVRRIVDTRLFQRLRRIEQTSIRSVYPSARHDRFIHSLGVYHIGSLIVEHLKKEAEKKNYWGITKNTLETIYQSYLVACLLHDIAHAPFSHAFEEYYGTKEELSSILKALIKNKNFSKDLNEINKKDAPNFHEYMSAYVAFKEYSKEFREMTIDAEFVARMITGVYYNQEKSTHQIHNCFVSLLHGRIIDADRLDYACRDVWASGYSTSSIDVRRLISAIHFEKNKEKEYVVCFESNSLNEIEGVLNVKDFQQKYVIHHHVVCYEQWLLIQAVENMALHFFPDSENGVAATRKIISKNSIINKTILKKGRQNFIVQNLSDDDLIFLLKQVPENTYYKQWSSRQYTHGALWKSRDEFFHFFANIDVTMDLQHKDFESRIKEILCKGGNLNENDIIVVPQEFKKRVRLESLYLLVNNDVVRYTDIHQEAKDTNNNQTFYYVFIPKGQMDRDEWQKYKMEFVNELKGLMIELYPPKENNVCQEDSAKMIKKNKTRERSISPKKAPIYPY